MKDLMVIDVFCVLYFLIVIIMVMLLFRCCIIKYFLIGVKVFSLFGVVWMMCLWRSGEKFGLVG